MSSRATYQPVPTNDDDKERGFGRFPISYKKKNIFCRILAVVFVMYIAMLGLRHLPRSLQKSLWSSTPCHGLQRNLSASTKLPSHYTLPSGDKIPSVALGILPSIYLGLKFV